MVSDFNFFLNRQGVKGAKGEKGEQGFSPIIKEGQNTANEYTLIIQNEDSSFESPNLRGNAIEDLGGTYIRFNPDTKEMHTGFADTATTESQGEVILSTMEEILEGGSEDTVPTSADMVSFVNDKIQEGTGGFVTTDAFNSFKTSTDTDIVNIKNTHNIFANQTTDKLKELEDGKLDKSEFTQFKTNEYNSFTNKVNGEILSLQNEKMDFETLEATLKEGNNVTLSVDSSNKTITINSSAVSDIKPEDIGAQPVIDDLQQIREGAAKGNTAVQPDQLNDLATTTQLNEVKNSLDNLATKDELQEVEGKIPTVNNSTVTINQGGEQKGTFTLNQAGDITIELDKGGSEGSNLEAGNGIEIEDNKINIIQEVSSGGEITPSEGYFWNTIGCTILCDKNGDILSNFHDSAFTTPLLVSEDFNATALTLLIKFTTGDSTTTTQGLFSFSNDSDQSFTGCLDGRIGGSSKLHISTGSHDGESLTNTASFDVEPNHTYSLKIEISNLGTAGVATLIDHSAGVETKTLIQHNTTFDLHKLTLGACRAQQNKYFGGTIDLSGTCIKLNNVLVDFIRTISTFALIGDKVPAVATDSLYGLVKPDNYTTTVSDGVISSVSSFGNIQGDPKDNELLNSYLSTPTLQAGNGISVDDNRINIKQINNDTVYTWSSQNKYGSVQVNDGIVSNFISNSYLRSGFGNFVTDRNVDTEMGVRFTTPSNISYDMGVFSFSANSGNPPRVTVGIIGGKLKVLVENTLDISNYFITNDPIEPNTEYNIIIHVPSKTANVGIELRKVQDNSVLKMTASSQDIIINVDYAFSTAYFGMGSMRDLQNMYFTGGTIDLNHSYVKASGVLSYSISSSEIENNSGVAIATDSLYGLVKPDGTTTKVADGIVSVNDTVIDDINSKTTPAEAAAAAMPSSSPEWIAFPASNADLVAPETGYYSATFVTANNSNFGKLVNTNSSLTFYTFATSTGAYINCWVPATKGDKVHIEYQNMNSSTSYIQFIRCNGGL